MAESVTFNQSRIESDGGDFIILNDFGMEGMTVASQHKTVMDAIHTFGSDYTPQVVVRLVRVTVTPEEEEDNED